MNPGIESSNQEEILWQGHPSQILNLRIYLLCGLTFFLVIPLFYAFWRWLKLKSNQYTVTTERILLTTGVFARQTDEVELYRVRDVSFSQSFFLRMFSLSNLTLTTTDPSNSIVVLEALSNARPLWDKIRQYSEICRKRKGISEIDFT